MSPQDDDDYEYDPNEDLSDIASRAHGLYIDLTGWRSWNEAVDGEEVIIQRVALALQDVACEATNRNVCIALNETEANMFKAGNHFTDISAWFGDEKSMILADGDNWRPVETEEEE